MEDGCRGRKGVQVSARSPHRRTCRGPLHSPVPSSRVTYAERVGVDIFRSQYTRLINSNGQWWRREGSRKRGEGSIRELERPSQRQRRKPWSCKSRHSGARGFIILALPFPQLFSRPVSFPLARHANQWYLEPRLGRELVESSTPLARGPTHVPPIDPFGLALVSPEGCRKNQKMESCVRPNSEQLILANSVGLTRLEMVLVTRRTLLGGRGPPIQIA